MVFRLQMFKFLHFPPAESQKKKQKDDDSDEFDDDDTEAGPSYQQQGVQQQQNFISHMNQSGMHNVPGAPGIPPGDGTMLKLITASHYWMWNSQK